MSKKAKSSDSGAEYGNVIQMGDVNAESGHSENASMPEMKLKVSANRRKFSPRGEVSQLLQLYFFVACVVVFFMCHSVVIDTCGSYVARIMHSTGSKKTFDLIDTFRVVLMIPYTFIFASHSSMLKKHRTFFRFIDDRVCPDDEWTAKSPPVVKRSFCTILMSYALINAYLLLLQLVLLLLQLQLDRADSPIASILGYRIISSSLRCAAFFLYTYQTFDIRTNLALLITLMDYSILSLSDPLSVDTVVLKSLSGFLFLAITSSLMAQYHFLCPRPIEPVRTVPEPSSESTQAINASTSQSCAAHPKPSVAGENGSAVIDNSTVSPSNIIAIYAECALLGCFFVLNAIAFFSCNGLMPLLQGTRTIFWEVVTSHVLIELTIFWVHALMILSCKSVIAQEYTVMRFINDKAGENVSENDETRAVDTGADVSRSTMPVWRNYIAMCLYQWLYLGLVTSALLVCPKFIGGVPDIIGIPTVYILSFAYFFSYTYRVFDLRTNIMIGTIIAFLVTPNALRRSGQDLVLSLMTYFLLHSYDYHCCIPLEPTSAIYGSYAPPVLSSQTGTGSDLEVDGVREVPNREQPSVKLNEKEKYL